MKATPFGPSDLPPRTVNNISPAINKRIMARTDLTLLQQMRITELSVANRKEVFGLTKADEEILIQAGTLIEQEIDAIVDEFYDAQTKVEDIATLIGDADTLSRLHQAQRRYILELFAGIYDINYVNSRLRIGMVHKRIGVEPALYLSAIGLLRDLILRYLQRRIDDAETVGRMAVALDRILSIDTSYVIDTYIRSLILEIEAGREKVEDYARSLEQKVTERTRELEELSRRDGLTGLFNARSFRDFLQRDLRVAERAEKPIALLYFDVDRFKEINDGQGHAAGDEVLQILGQVLLEICREGDVPCRYGGDEFCVILPNSDISGAQAVAERLVNEFAARRKDVTLSIGVAQNGPDRYDSLEIFVACADARMYESKKSEGFKISA